MNRTEHPAASLSCLPYTNLFTYQSHGPPHYGTGIRAPIFAATPMRSAFARGNCEVNTQVVSNATGCGNHVHLGPNPNQYAAPEKYPIDLSYVKMMRCKANTLS